MKNKKLYIFGGLTCLLIFIAIFAKYLTPYDPYMQDLSLSLQGPSSMHLLGCDRYGRDIFSRVILGSQVTILSTLLLVLIITCLGSVIGLISGYYGGIIDQIFMRITDIFLAFPGMVFALAIATILPGGIFTAIFSLALVSWPKYARLVRSEVLSIKEKPYIDALKLTGQTSKTIMIKHILPHIYPVIIITSLLDISTMMMELAGLSFLGLGALPPLPEWGSMMSVGRSMLQTSPWIIFGPGLAMFITLTIFNLFGDSVQEYLERNKK